MTEMGERLKRIPLYNHSVKSIFRALEIIGPNSLTLLIGLDFSQLFAYFVAQLEEKPDF